jgi:hypothetical protein
VQFVSTESTTRISWQEDELRWSRVEFLGPAGEDSVDKTEFRELCSGFIDAVIRRLNAMGLDETPLQQEWTTIQGADHAEEEFCKTAGGIGWDPYSLSDSERAVILKIDRILSDSVFEQAVPILDPSNVDRDLEAILSGLQAGRRTRLTLTRFRAVTADAVRASRGAKYAVPWQAGYALARSTRRKLGLDGQPLASFRAIGDAIGEDPKTIEHATSPINFGAAPLLDAIVTMADSSAPGFAFQNKPEPARRFHFCRALAETLLHPGEDVLLTRANSERQSLSRAFAAEFLAPADALRSMVSQPIVGDDELNRLAAEFGVSARVIEHQLENHHIARTGRRRGTAQPPVS